MLPKMFPSAYLSTQHFPINSFPDRYWPRIQTGKEGGWAQPDDLLGLESAEMSKRILVLKDDDEILSIIANIITSGIL